MSVLNSVKYFSELEPDQFLLSVLESTQSVFFQFGGGAIDVSKILVSLNIAKK